MKNKSGRTGQKSSTLSLGNDFGRMVVEGAGIKVVLDSDGHVTLYRNGYIVYPNGAANAPADVAPPSASDYEDSPDPDYYEEPEIGQTMRDGTVYAGISPTTDTKMYALPADAPEIMTRSEGVKYTFNLKAHGHKGSKQNRIWRMYARMTVAGVCLRKKN